MWAYCMEGIRGHARIQKIFSGGGGGGSKFPEGVAENFNMAKIDNLAMGGGPDPLSPPQDPPMGDSLNAYQ